MFKNILIIGFGMIGSSIARSIPKSRKQAHIYAFDKSKDFSKRLKKANLNVSSITVSYTHLTLPTNREV